MAKGDSKQYVDNVGGKTLNLFIFSVFEINYKRTGKIPLVYRSVGVLENFIVINDYREEF
ncbi:MAG: hypothetical protein JKX82_00140 [Oleispira sp.]|nr:hypothetical protein [Oleispira sp.]